MTYNLHLFLTYCCLVSWSSAGRHGSIKVAKISKIETTLNSDNLVKLVFIGIDLKVDKLRAIFEGALAELDTNVEPTVSSSHALKPLLLTFYDRLEQNSKKTSDK